MSFSPALRVASRHGGIGDGKWQRPRLQGWTAESFREIGSAWGREVGRILSRFASLLSSSSLRKLDDVRKVQRPLNHNQLQVQGNWMLSMLVQSVRSLSSAKRNRPVRMCGCPSVSHPFDSSCWFVLADCTAHPRGIGAGRGHQDISASLCVESLGYCSGAMIERARYRTVVQIGNDSACRNRWPHIVLVSLGITRLQLEPLLH